MPTVDQYLRTLARSQPDTPFWVLEKDKERINADD
jgi:hypothetical protein